MIVRKWPHDGCLQLLEALTPEPKSAHTLARELDVPLRTLRDRFVRLKEEGFPVLSMVGTGGGYALGDWLRK